MALPVLVATGSVDLSPELALGCLFCDGHPLNRMNYNPAQSPKSFTSRLSMRYPSSAPRPAGTIP